jgi:hypothetical protein
MTTDQSTLRFKAGQKVQTQDGKQFTVVAVTASAICNDYQVVGQYHTGLVRASNCSYFADADLEPLA